MMLSANLLKSEPLIKEKTKKNTRKEKKSGLILHPIFYYTPETKTAFGAGGMYFFQTSKNKSRIRHSYILLGVEYTLMNQFKFGLEPDIYLKNEKYHLTGGISFRKFPSKFYGIGNNTSVDMEESYTPNTIDLRMALQRKVRSELFLGLEYVFTQDSINEVEEDRLLAGEKSLAAREQKHRALGSCQLWTAETAVSIHHQEIISNSQPQFLIVSWEVIIVSKESNLISGSTILSFHHTY
jgi:hypothetical protein